MSLTHFLLIFFLLFTAPLIGQDRPLPLIDYTNPASFKDKEHLHKSLIKQFAYINDLGFFRIEESSGKINIGAIDKQGKIIIAPVYKSFSHEGLITILKRHSNQYEFYTSKFKLINTEVCDSFNIDGNIILFSNNFKWGAYLLLKKEVRTIPTKFKRITLLSNGIHLEQYNQWKFSHSSNESCCVYADSLISKDSVLYYSRGGLFGLIGLENPGKELTKSIYSEITIINKNAFLVKEKDKFGLITNNGEILIFPQYDSLEVIGKGQLKGFLNKKGWRLFSLNGDSLTGSFYEDVKEESEGLIPVKVDANNSLWGFVDRSDSLILPAIYNEVESFLNEKAKVKVNDKTLIIDRQGKVVADSLICPLYAAGLFSIDSTGKISYLISPIAYSSIKSIGDGLVLVRKESNYGIIDSNGRVVIPVEYTSIIPSKKEKVFKVYNGNKFGIVDYSGIVLSELHDRFEKVYDFHEGRSKFLKAGKYGFIDIRGNVRVAPQYKHVHEYKEGAVAVFLNGKWGFIDGDEAILIQPLYDEVRDIQNGLARVRINKQWMFVRKDGSLVSKISYDSIETGVNGDWLIYKDGKVGLADSTGREKIAPRYSSLKDYGGIIVVEKYDKWGSVDGHENSIFPIEYNDIIYSNKYSVFAIMTKGDKETLKIDNEK